ncbi:MAG: hypothetical protein R3F02_19505 [Thiolinea sp.]
MIKWYLGLPRHLRIAIILAPFLGIFGWGLADTWMRPETIERAKQLVAVREMVVEDQCLLKAARCKLSKDEMDVSLEATQAASSADLLRVDIRSSQHMRGLKVAIVQGGTETKLVPQRTHVTDHWFLEFPAKLIEQPSFTLRIAVAQTKRVYLAEFPAKFE